MTKITLVFRNIIILLALFVAMATRAEVTEVVASVDKNPAMSDESITLTITASGSADREAFDPSPLLKDFVVGRTSVSSQTQIINFDTTRTTQWSTILIPRKPGRFTIPSFTIEGQQTQPIALTVIPPSASAGGERRELFVTTEIDMPSVYLQQQVKYTVKLHISQDLQRGSLEAPAMQDAEVRQVGEDKEYSEIVDGQRYRIIERVFAIIPQKSGRYTINGPLFEGEIIDGSRQSFGFFNRTKTVRRVGPEQSLEVLPIPADYTSHWLPSEYVELNEEWQSANQQYRVGEPITRTLTLTAVGLVEEQLPEIASQYPDAMKTYPDQANTATVERDDTLIAQRVESIAIIPNVAGEITIPEVSIPWFNVVTKQTQTATLPARTITVLPAVGDTQPALPVTPQPVDDTATGQQDSPPVTDLSSPQTAAGWWSVSSWVFMLLWLFTLAAWLWQSRRNKGATAVNQADASEQQLWSALQQALGSHDARQIYAPLGAWLGQVSGHPSRSLVMSQRALGRSDLDREIEHMYQAQYAREQSAWRSDTLLSVLKSIREGSREQQVKGIRLENLYPQSQQ